MIKTIQKFSWQEIFLPVPILGYILSGLTIVPLHLAAFILIKPWSLWTYRKVSYYFSLIMYWHATFLVLWWSDTNIKIFMDPNDLLTNIGHEHSIFLSNHKYENEIFVIMSIWNFFRSVGNLRWFAKKDIQYLPITGWLWKLHEYIFLERNFDKDKQIVERNVQSLMEHSDAVTIALFAEGTRFTEQKHRVSMIVAKKKGLSELRHHLLPRTRGFVTCINTLKKGHRFGLPIVVYDALLIMEHRYLEGKTFSLLDLLRGHGPQVKMLLRRYILETIPEGEAEYAQWLYRIYQEKDAFMENYFKTGCFLKDEKGNEVGLNLKDFEIIKVPKPLHVLAFIGSWNFACLLGILGKILIDLQSGDNIQLMIFVALTIIGNIVFSTLNGSSKVQKASSYGKFGEGIDK